MTKASAFTFYFLFFAAMASLLPFFVLYYQSLGFSGVEIGLLTGISPLVTLVGAPLWTGVADATRSHKFVMTLALAGIVVLALVFPIATALGPVLLLIILYSFFVSPITSLADSATMSMLGGERDLYGRLRLGGTIGWGLAAAIVGFFIEAHGLKVAFWSFALLMAFALLVSRRFTFPKPAVSVPVRSGIRTLLTNRRWISFLCLAFVSGIGLASINNYLFPYMQEMNASKTTMGLAMTIAALSELPVLYFANRLLRILTARGLMILAMAVLGLRMLLYAALNFPAGILFFQICNGLTFPAFWIAGVSYAYEHTPPGLSATGQGFFAAMVFGFGAAAGGLLGGFLLEGMGGRGLFLVFGTIVLAGTIVIGLWDWRLRGETVT